MGILNFSIRSQDLDNNADPDGSIRIAEKTIKLEKTFKMKYLKLLHIYHNITNANISDDEGTSENTILFAKISFLNTENTVFYEHKNNQVIEHGGMICLGETVKEEGSSVFKELYKVLHDGKQILFLNQPFTIQLFKLQAADPAVDNTSVATYNSSESHLLKPINISEFRGPLDSAGQYVSFTFEYSEDYSK